jgi:hypothetical protein
MKNPLSGLVYCGQCGRSMSRRPYTTGQKSTLVCAYTSCSTVSSYFDAVESAILPGLREWLGGLELGERAADDGAAGKEIGTLEKAAAAVQKELDTLRQQETRAYELVEQNVYTPEIFLERTRDITRRRDELLKKQRTVQSELDARADSRTSTEVLAPTIRYVLDAYDLASTPEEKNRLLKTVLAKAVYTKSTNTRWDPSVDDMKLVLYPKLPQHSH